MSEDIMREAKKERLRRLAEKRCAVAKEESAESSAAVSTPLSSKPCDESSRSSAFNGLNHPDITENLPASSSPHLRGLDAIVKSERADAQRVLTMLRKQRSLDA